MTKTLIRSLAAIGVLAGVVFISVSLANRTDPIDSRLDLAISQSPGQDNQLTGTLEIVLDDKALASFATIGEYKPTAAMTDIIDHLDLNDGGWWLINETQPEFISRVEMAKLCGPKAFGCFIGYKNQSGQSVGSSIAVVRDLAHKQSVEALAHELLHGAYHHLDGFNLDQVNGWIDAAYSDNQDPLDRRLEPYGQQTTNSRYHELHSFIGTIVDDLPPEFEAHYRQYFNNRGLIVSHAPNGSHDNPEPTPQSPQTQTTPPAPAPQSAPTPDPDPETAAIPKVRSGFRTLTIVNQSGELDLELTGRSLWSYPANRQVKPVAWAWLYVRLESPARAYCKPGQNWRNNKPSGFTEFDHLVDDSPWPKVIGGSNPAVISGSAGTGWYCLRITDENNREYHGVAELQYVSDGASTPQPTSQAPAPTIRGGCVFPAGWDDFTLAQKIAANPCGCDIDRYPTSIWPDGSCHPPEPNPPTPTPPQTSSPSIIAQEGDISFSLAGRRLTANLDPVGAEAEAPQVIAWGYLYWSTESLARSYCSPEGNQFDANNRGTTNSLNLADRHLGNWFCFRAIDESGNQYFGLVGISE